jgi:hypothetical protein
MVAQNLHFFDKFGKNLNLQANATSGVWEGKVYFEGISTYLFDNENLFILEKVGSLYKFPTLAQNQSLEFSWDSNKNENEFFIYDVEKDLQLNEQFISRVESKKVSHSDFNLQNNTNPLDLTIPLQLNIAFNPSQEIKFERTLNIFLIDTTSTLTRTKIAEIYFYGEGIEEEERFRIWANNFGIKFLREDANILKDYDIKEAIPDYQALNQIRKELLVNKEQIYPYIGTYKGLSNFINILGYKDVLQIKEYWQNVNSKSANANKLLMVDISDYLDDGIIETLDLNDKNKNIKEGKQFKKTEFLALVYQFTRPTDNYDDDGVPLVEETTEFTVNEIFYKLNLLNDKLKNEFLPVNVKIKDIIGEFIYFQKFTISYWRDDTRIFDYDLNETADILNYPGNNVNFVLRSLSPLFGKKSESGIDFGTNRINTNSALNPFKVGQKYSRQDIIKISENIKKFYDEIREQRFPNLGARLNWENGDDPERIIGAPVIFTVDTGKFTISDLNGVKLEDLDAIGTGLDPHWTLENIDYRNFYEVNWKITKDSPNPYYFEHRGKITELFELPHIFPYAGKYRVTVELFDFYGNVSVYSRFITVEDTMKPEIVAFTRLEDKFNYSIGNLANVQLKDFGASTLYYSKVTVLDNEESAVKIDVYRNLLEWISFYKNRYGMGQNLYDAELFDVDTQAFVPYNSTYQNHPKKLYWGLGEDTVPVKIKDFRDVEVGELYFMRLTDLVYSDDFLAGFYIHDPKPGQHLNISLFPDYILPNFNSLNELINILNSSDSPGVKLFNYSIINGRKSDRQYIIHAQANYLSKEAYHILMDGGIHSPSTSPSSSPLASPSNGLSSNDKYTFFLPKNVYSRESINFLKSLSPVFDEETLFLLAKTSDLLSGVVQDPGFWQDSKYWKFNDSEQVGHLPTTLDQNAFNINDIKIFQETFAVPENAILFFTVNNLDGKNEFIWKLTDNITGEEIIQVKTVPFFVWKFKDLGNFNLSVEVTDNRGTKYFTQVQNLIRVLDKRQYIKEIEGRLNKRKQRLLKTLS